MKYKNYFREFTITYYARSYYIHSIGIKNIHGVVTHRESGMDEPLAEIVIWRWNSYKQEIIKVGIVFIIVIILFK